MSENSLVNRYKRYKAGTTKIATWLSNSARHCQDITTILPSLRAANNASKQAKKNKTISPSATEGKVTTAQLVKLAEIVVSRSVTISEDILGTLKDVIAARQVCAKWYGSLPGSNVGSLAEKNSKHKHCIDVLQEVLRLLETAHEAQSSTRRSKPTKSIEAKLSCKDCDSSKQHV